VVTFVSPKNKNAVDVANVRALLVLDSYGLMRFINRIKRHHQPGMPGERPGRRGAPPGQTAREQDL
jgi:hypothetical protein